MENSFHNPDVSLYKQKGKTHFAFATFVLVSHSELLLLLLLLSFQKLVSESKMLHS